MFERSKKNDSRKKRLGGFFLAFTIHASAIAALLFLTTKVAPVVIHDGVIVIFHPPATPPPGNGTNGEGGKVARATPTPRVAATPTKIAKQDIVQPHAIDAIPTPSADATPVVDDSQKGALDGFAGQCPTCEGAGKPGPKGPPCLPGADCNGGDGKGGTGGPVDLGNTGISPVAIFQPQPAYPAAARATGITGEVVVEMIVGIDGNVRSARLVAGSAPFAEAALSTVRTWRYRPVEIAGQPIVWKSTVTLRFRIH